ncbi:hypothetical protein MKW98_030647 [Papaver atlanticum]|uniref:glucose-1-phosphate adenylyltransferase n=1 Tax=Papaver atlanticum TaxID=357466 RepID=A0AAD4RU80_9MAGN|nr:hypothetical protein MKW98_030647 [Papaver atlanticum]
MPCSAHNKGLKNAPKRIPDGYTLIVCAGVDDSYEPPVNSEVDTTILGLDDKRAKEMPFIASMGIYVVSKNVMLNLLRDKFPGANDFGSEVIPGATSMGLREPTIEDKPPLKDPSRSALLFPSKGHSWIVRLPLDLFQWLQAYWCTNLEHLLLGLHPYHLLHILLSL